MRKWVFRILPALFYMILAHTGTAQRLDSMLSVSERIMSEKIHIHFDRGVYSRGETVWYKIYLLHNSNDTVNSSKNVYLEWYDADGKMITHVTAPLILSTAQGAFDIPGDYKGGSLQVKAYTRWMLNDDPAFSYQRELVIHTGTTNKAGSLTNKTTVETFPEGGFLVQGLFSRVAFKATNPYGSPVLIKAELTDDSNSIIDSVNVQHDGMGSFYFIPLSGRSYKLNWIDENGLAGSTPVPVTKKEGAVLTVKAAGDKALFQVQRTDNVPENFKKMILLVHMNQVVLYRITLNAEEKTVLNSEIPVSNLPTGLVQFTLFSSDWLPIAERVVFINNRSHAFDVKVSAPLVNMNGKGKNAVEISVPDTLFTNMSLAITDAAVNPFDQHSIFSDVLLSSEIRGKIYNPGYYFSENTERVAEDMDLLMLTHAWRRYDWDKIRTHTKQKINYPAETEYMKMRGTVQGIKADSTVVVNMIIMGKHSSNRLISVPVSKDGSFEYPVVFFDTAKVYYTFNNNKAVAKNARLEIGNDLMKPAALNIGPTNGTVFTRSDNQGQQRLDAFWAQQELLRKKMAAATLKEVTVYTRPKTKEELLSDKYSMGFFKLGRAYIYDLTDPTKTIFPRNVLEFLQAKIPGLTIVGGGNTMGETAYKVAWRGYIAGYDSPDYFIDEMPVDQRQFLDLPMVNIAMIKAYPPIFMFSPTRGRGGAIVAYTKMGGDEKILEPYEKGMDNTVLAGYSKYKEFFSPDYEQQKNEFAKTDNRTTLYWNPYLMTNKNLQSRRIEFFNNDFTKTFYLVLEGINAAGKMMRVVRTIDANKN
jgi:hypothetical protein